MKFVKFNNNPKGRKTTDCAVRAISFALDISWEEAFKRIVDIAIENGFGYADIEVLNATLMNYETKVLHAAKGSTRPKVKDFTDGTYVLRIAHHLACVKDGELFDIWDCREKAVYRYWRIK